MRDILEQLRTDAGQLTIAALIAQREAAASEIAHLRETIDQLRSRKPRADDTRQRPPLFESPSQPKICTFVSPQNPDVLLRLRDVLQLIGVGRSTVYKWVSKGTFPRPFQIGARAVAWKATDIAHWRTALDQAGRS